MDQKELLAQARGEIRVVPIKWLKPYGRNPRKISDAAVDLVAESIRRFGWKQYIVANGETGVILAGHTRYAAALKLRLEQVPIRVSDLSPEDEQVFRLVDNRAHELSDWEKEDLSSELRAIVEAGGEPIGFEEDVRELLAAAEAEEAAAAAATEPEPAEATEPEEPPQVCPTCGRALDDD